MITICAPFKVYLVIDDSPDGAEPKALFTTRTLAKEFIKKAKGTDPFVSQYLDIKKMTLQNRLSK